MSLRCRLFGHEPAPVWNGGHHFSTCKRCGIDLMRGRGMVWRPVPPGMRVVWKTRTEIEVERPAGAERERPVSETS